jgi:hypothetical protein
MRETDLYQPIISSMLEENFLVHKIVDGSAGKKPGDITGIDRITGRGVLLEVKAPSKPMEATSVNWALFESHQIAWLRAYASSNGLALVAIYDKTSSKLWGWSMTGPNDQCDRPPDIIFVRSGDSRFAGWRILCLGRLSILGCLTKDHV